MRKSMWGLMLLIVGCGLSPPGASFRTAVWTNEPAVHSRGVWESLTYPLNSPWGRWTARSPRPLAPPTIEEPASREFDQFDRDHNGLLSQSEYVEGKWSLIRFFKAPTPAEIRHMKAQLASDFRRADLTRDGWLNPYEYAYASETPEERDLMVRQAIRQLTLR